MEELLDENGESGADVTGVAGNVGVEKRFREDFEREMHHVRMEIALLAVFPGIDSG